MTASGQGRPGEGGFAADAGRLPAAGAVAGGAGSGAARSGSAQGEPGARLAELRGAIDDLDAQLVRVLAERFRTTAQVGRLKADWDLPARDAAREAEQTARLKRLAADSGLDPDFTERLFRVIVDQVVENHKATAARR
ncbi:MAG: chorismate mutase [Bifidobacteriaceae bacterium]|jgi:chorismate mutase|nr:chorismate mutase [Bifidobacteriaceae bacterium]